MPLNWNISNVENYDDLYECTNPDAAEDDRNYKLDGLTESFIFTTMAIGLNEITEKNAEQFHARNAFLVKVLDAGVQIWTGDDEDARADWRPANMDEIYRRIGLATNASTLTRTEFINRIVANFERNHATKL